MEMKNIIVDCDPGIDDALALIMLFNAHKAKKIKLVAVTCVHGNAGVKSVARNVCRTMSTCGIMEIPVYEGAYAPLMTKEDRESDEHYNGRDIFQEVFSQPPDMSPIRKNHASYALNKITTANPGEITMICLGPLTNIALAIRLYPEFVNNVKEFYVMGGNSNAQGNSTSQAEFNFFSDPESAFILLHSIERPISLLPWECCLKSRITHEWRKNVLGKINIPAINMLNKLEEVRYVRKDRQWNYFIPNDAIMVGIVLKPEIAKNVSQCYADVELEGPKTRGQVVIDHLFAHEPNINLIDDFDSEIFKTLLVTAMDPEFE